MDELFISSTAGGLMPISKVDGQAIGTSPVGPVTAVDYSEQAQRTEA